MLLIGYGNPGRCDDGLGPAFAARVSSRNLPELTVISDYQLTVDHALSVAKADQLIFVDADLGAPPPFRFTRVTASHAPEIGSHSIDPASLMALTASLYGAKPEAYALGIAGEDFGRVHEGLTAVAEQNLDAAEAFFLRWFAEATVAAS